MWMNSNDVDCTNPEINQIGCFEFQFVVVAGDMDKPMAIAVDPVAGLMFWTDRGRTPKIERAHLDGSHRRVLVNETIHFTTGLTLDYIHQKVRSNLH